MRGKENQAMPRKQRSKGAGSIYKRVPKGPWILSYFDHMGRRRERSSRTTDRSAAERILNKIVADEALRRARVIDPRQDRMSAEAQRAIAEHFADYITHCQHASQATRHVLQKRSLLRKFAEQESISRLADMTPGALEGYLRHLKSNGRSARTLNFARQNVLAFYEWCVKMGRAESNTLSCVPKQDERRDRRRIRRPLSEDELGRLLAVARRAGREEWYLAAVMAGLRKGDLQRIRWCDLDFEQKTLTIRDGKSRRCDVLPMHPQLAAALWEMRERTEPRTMDPIWPRSVSDRTRMRDFLEAGIARRIAIQAGPGVPIRWKIVAEDEQGRVADLHALRMTLGTSLARAGVAPQVAQRLLRHSDYKTTMNHYTSLGLRDVAAAVEALPRVPVVEVKVPDFVKQPQQYSRQLGRDGERVLATDRETRHFVSEGQDPFKPPQTTMKTLFTARGQGQRAKGIEPSTFSLEG